MKSQDVRQTFLNYFKKRGLPILPSSPLIPHGDPTLLFTSAGMVQFKANFLGLKKNLKNATTCQKCVRTTDIDNVGFTKRHLTFFEMLGNFSFGDYFKKEAIAWAWDFLTNELKIDKDRLYVSIYKGGLAPRDEEAYEAWSKLVSKDRIYEFDEKDNFWTMGPTGPCGPCSEIYYDFGEDKGCPDCAKNGIACDCGRFVEIWNLVFTQFNRLEDGTLELLPQKNIDTGMGLERLCMVMQGVDNPFDTDLFTPIAAHAKKLLHIEGKTKEEQTILRIVCDHIRSSCFLIAEGVLPSNEGRGYILRRIIRRAARYGRLAGRTSPFMWELVPTVVEMYYKQYPELQNSILHITNTLKAEGAAFYRTLTEGEERLAELLKNNPKEISSEEAFYLYETYGYPFELTKEILAEKNIKVDEEGFYTAQEKAKESSKKLASEFDKERVITIQKLEGMFGATNFVGYEELSSKAKIIALLNKDFKEVNSLDKEGYAVFDKTPFYAESGGQVGDIGLIYKNNEAVARITDTQKPLERIFLHKIALIKGKLEVGEKVFLQVDELTRMKTAANHTSVHLINAALKKIFGEHVRQAGSYVDSERFRFDYTLSSAPQQSKLIAVISEANNLILQRLKVETEVRPLSDAKELGATTLLGETYADPARFVLISKEGFKDPMDRASLELCGGTHVKNTGDIMVIRVLKDSAVSNGVRRIEGVGGLSAIEVLKSMANAAKAVSLRLNTSVEEIDNRVSTLLKAEKELRKEVLNLRQKLASQEATDNIEKFTLKDGAKLVVFDAKNTPVKELRTLADNLADKHKGSAVLVASGDDTKRSFVVKSFEGGLKAGDLVKQLSSALNGRGGGRPDFAQGGIQSATWQDLTELIKGL